MMIRRSAFFLLMLTFFAIHVSAQKRIISLAPSLTQNLFLLGAEDEVVGYTSYCEIAVQSKKPIVASAVKVNLEKVVSLKPDIIVATTITNPETIEQLRQFGIQVEVYPTPDSFNEICRQFVEMGNLIDKKEQAEKITSASKHKVDSLTRVMASLPHKKMLFQIGANPLYCVPPGTFMSDYIKFANGENISDTPNNGSINRETVAVRNPDIIFLTAMGIVGEDEKKQWEEFPEINAVKNNTIYILDSNKSCSPTPVTFVETLDTIAQLIQ